MIGISNSSLAALLDAVWPDSAKRKAGQTQWRRGVDGNFLKYVFIDLFHFISFHICLAQRETWHEQVFLRLNFVLYAM